MFLLFLRGLELVGKQIPIFQHEPQSHRLADELGKIGVLPAHFLVNFISFDGLAVAKFESFDGLAIIVLDLDLKPPLFAGLEIER